MVRTNFGGDQCDILGMIDHLFALRYLHQDHGVHVELIGRSRVWSSGPHPDVDRARAAAHRYLGVLDRAARQLGGWAWRPDASHIAVCLPDTVPVVGSAPLIDEEARASWHRWGQM